MGCGHAPVAVQTFGGPVGTARARSGKLEPACAGLLFVATGGSMSAIAAAATKSAKQDKDPMPPAASQQSASARSASATTSPSVVSAWWLPWFDSSLMPCITDAAEAPANVTIRRIKGTKRNMPNTYRGYEILTSHEDVSLEPILAAHSPAPPSLMITPHRNSSACWQVGRYRCVGPMTWARAGTSDAGSLDPFVCGTHAAAETVGNATELSIAQGPVRSRRLGMLLRCIRSNSLPDDISPIREET